MPVINITIAQGRYTKLEATANDAGFTGSDAVRDLMLSLLKDYHVNQRTMKEHKTRDAAVEAARKAALADVEGL